MERNLFLFLIYTMLISGTFIAIAFPLSYIPTLRKRWHTIQLYEWLSFAFVAIVVCLTDIEVILIP